jgi:hypothetical protein
MYAMSDKKKPARAGFQLVRLKLAGADWIGGIVASADELNQLNTNFYKVSSLGYIGSGERSGLRVHEKFLCGESRWNLHLKKKTLTM